MAADLVRKQRTTPDQRDLAYRSFIESLAAWGVLDQLPLDHNGVLQVLDVPISLLRSPKEVA